MPLLNPSLMLTAKSLIVNWSSPQTKRETGVNEPTTAVSLCFVSQEECMPRCRENNWTRAWWYPVRFASWPQHYRTNFHSSANFQEILGACQRCLPMFCRPLESIWPGSSWKALGSVAGVRCWRPPVTGHPVTDYRYSCSEVYVPVDGVNSQPFTVGVGLRQCYVLRGVTKLDGARGKKQVWRPHVRNWGLPEGNALYWRKYLWHCWDSSAASAAIRSPLPWFGAWRIVLPLPPGYAPVCALTTPLHSLIRVLHTLARGSNPTCEAISPGSKTHFANNEKIIYLRKLGWFGRM